jgi:trehalose 6-phosphate synthase
MSKLVIVANRLPIEPPRRKGQPWQTAPGGLVAALTEVLQEREGTWVGWPGTRQEFDPPEDVGFELQPIHLTAEEIAGHYDGFSNATLWPLYHDLVERPVFRRDWWAAYERVNTKFATAIAKYAPEKATIWIQDYQLQLVPSLLRDLRPDLHIGFFLHIPFPAPELFFQLPWRRQIASGILGADVIGFQTAGDVHNFRQVVDRLPNLLRDATKGARKRRTITIEAFPVSIDFRRWDALAATPEVEDRRAELLQQLGRPRTVLLGVDRLDYTKGIENRLIAFQELLVEGRLHVPNAVMIQVASPSRDRTQAYKRERARIERLVGEINGDFGQVGVPAVHYIHQSLSPVEVAALYRTSDVMLVTPFRDGMNLVAKEFVACRTNDLGSLVLSEFAGVAAEFSEALLVNPYDVDEIKSAIMHAVRLPAAEARDRMRAMRRVVRTHDVHDWANDFLDGLEDARG